MSSAWYYPPFEQLGPDVEKLLFSPGIFLPADCWKNNCTNKIDLRKCSKTVNILFSPQKPFAAKGSKTWTQKALYPGWAVFIAVMMVLVSTLPILIWLIKDWPKNWRAIFYRTFCSGLNNYLPEPWRQETAKVLHNGMKKYAIDGGQVWSVKECLVNTFIMH